MKQVIRIHIEHELDEESVSEIKKLSEEEINNRLKSLSESLKGYLDEFPEESFKQFNIFLTRG